MLESIDETDFQVIFVTAFKEHAIRAFKANAIHYLLKPIDIEELKEAVSKAVEFNMMIKKDEAAMETYHTALKNIKPSILSGESPRITVTHAKGIKIIKQDDIAYLEGSGNCTWIRFVDGTSFLDTRTLKTYESLLNPELFYRIHKSYIINLKYLKEYLHDQGHYVVLDNGVNLPVARNRASDFVKAVKAIE